MKEFERLAVRVFIVTILLSWTYVVIRIVKELNKEVPNEQIQHIL